MPHAKLGLFAALICWSVQALEQEPDAIRIGPGITPPRVIRKVEPKYSPLARADNVQGTLILQIVINEKGRATDITVLSPLGFGLDENAQAAVEKWEFMPGMKDGRPVKVEATVEVNFRFQGEWFDEKTERQRTDYNLAARTFNRENSKKEQVEDAVKTIQRLSQQKFPAAMCLEGIWRMRGDHVAKDSKGGWTLIEKAASKNYGPAIYEIALRRIKGEDVPQDIEKGLQEMRDAATLGSPQAQFYLGNKYQNGDGVEVDPDRARRYFRLCSARGVGACQYRLAELLMQGGKPPERDLVQAVALFQLAAEQGVPGAKEIAAKEEARLTDGQRKWVGKLKEQLVRK